MSKPTVKITIRPKKYISHGGRLVKAIKVTEKNYVQVFNWVDKFNARENNAALSHVADDGDVSRQRVRVHTPKGIRVANVGEWVTGELNDKGLPVAFWVFKDDFDKKYDLV